MKIAKVIGNDPREIDAIFGPQESWSITAGKSRTKKIVAYIEDGDVPWFAIIGVDGSIISRVNSRYVEAVTYAVVKEADHDAP